MNYNMIFPKIILKLRKDLKSNSNLNNNIINVENSNINNCKNFVNQ